MARWTTSLLKSAPNEDEDEPIAADVEPLSSISRFLEKYSEVAML